MKALLFPGQGAQFKGMGKDLFPLYREQAELASSVLGYCIETLCLEDPDDLLRLTQYTQPALFVVNALRYFSWRDGASSDAQPHFLAGHSLGECNALLAAGCFDFETGLRMVQKRGQLMAEVAGGGMLVVLGIGAEDLAQLLRDHRLESIDLANFNSPLQTVVSGPAGDVARLEQACQAQSVDCLPVNVSGPFHSRYMQAQQPAFESFLRGLELRDPRIPVISNVTALPYRGGELETTLAAQIARSVDWVGCIRYLAAQGVDEFVELGPKLAGARPTPLIRMVNEIRKAVVA
ncbi:MAG: ACP S-malonyltransferase [Nevskia sp.]|nr:ACP S-malonyltransferase [Nevskia sp.]